VFASSEKGCKGVWNAIFQPLRGVRAMTTAHIAFSFFLVLTTLFAIVFLWRRISTGPAATKPELQAHTLALVGIIPRRKLVGKVRLFSENLRTICMAVAAVSLFSACNQSVDLDAIKTLANATAASADSYNSLSGDFQSSCIRAYEWEWAGARTHSRFPSLDSACGANQRAAVQWRDANLVVLSYVRALGSLAGGNDTKSDFGIPNLIDKINSGAGTGMSKAQSSAISTAATAIVTDIFNIRRRNEISKYAPKANADLDSLIAALEQVATTNYSTQLDLETDAIDHFYAPVAPQEVSGPGLPATVATVKGLRVTARSERPMSVPVGTVVPKIVNQTLLDFDKVQLLTLRDRYRLDRAAVADRRKAIGAYVDSLEALKSAHSSLVEAITSNKPGDVAKIVQAYVDEFRPDIKTIDDAFKGGS
jgi:hypothetical protein